MENSLCQTVVLWFRTEQCFLIWMWDHTEKLKLLMMRNYHWLAKRICEKYLRKSSSARCSFLKMLLSLVPCHVYCDASWFVKRIFKTLLMKSYVEVPPIFATSVTWNKYQDKINPYTKPITRYTNLALKQ